MTAIDFILGPLYFVLVLVFANILKKRLAKTEIQKKYYFKILFFKLFAVTFFAFIYQFYYRGGDTMVYYDCCDRMTKFMFTNPGDFFDLILFNSKQAFYILAYQKYSICNYFLGYNTREFAFVKVVSLVNLFALNSYLSTSYLLAFISFIANWKLFQIFEYYYPSFEKNVLFSTMLVPSVAFWGSGILKDSVTFIFLCFFLYGVFLFMTNRKKILLAILLIFVSAISIATIKGYIILALLPSVGLWVYAQYKNNIKSKVIRIIATPIIAAIVVLVLYLVTINIQNSLNKFSLDKLNETAESFQRWHTVASQDGSGYTLSVHDFSYKSLVIAIPETLNVTFFRPYLWEVSSPVVMLSAVESLFIFILFLRILVKSKGIYFFKIIFNSPFLEFCFVFSIIFSLVVGLTSFNFGALSRYKIPAMPIFVTMLVIVYYELKNNKSIGKR